MCANYIILFYSIALAYAPINVNHQRGWGTICGVLDHQLHPHPGDFDQHFGPELGQFEPNDFY